MDRLVSAKPPPYKSTWDRDEALYQMQSVSLAHERLYSDSHEPKRSARFRREREDFLSYRPEPAVKPEGYELTMKNGGNATIGNTQRRKYVPRPSTAKIQQQSSYHVSSRDVGAYKSDPTLVELAPAMLLANAKLSRSIKEGISFNPYPQHLNVTPRTKDGNPLLKKVPTLTVSEVQALHSTFFVSPKPEQSKTFTAKNNELFTHIMYGQLHKQFATVHDQGHDPFKLTKEDMFNMKNEAKYGSKFIGPILNMGSVIDYNYDEYHPPGRKKRA